MEVDFRRVQISDGPLLSVMVKYECPSVIKISGVVTPFNGGMKEAQPTEVGGIDADSSDEILMESGGRDRFN